MCRSSSGETSFDLEHRQLESALLYSFINETTVRELTHVAIRWKAGVRTWLKMSVAQATVTDRGKNKLDSAIIWQMGELILSDK